MRLTVFSDYSLRVLIYLALQPDGLVTIGQIAEAYGISRNHLMKVVRELGASGYVATVRGKGGGLRLARSAAEIRLGEVLRTFEEEALVECLSPEDANCRILPACVLPAMLREASASFYDTLNRYTLADLVSPRRRLGTLLALRAETPARGARGGR